MKLGKIIILSAAVFIAAGEVQSFAQLVKAGADAAVKAAEKL